MTVIRGELNLFRWLFGLIIGLNLAILFNLCLPEFERAPHGNMARSRTQ
uniref:Uncharacterized protein n=1 Tax=Candidatus Kentrum sp. DK TaxID=2126562 RepID=A0A450S7C9_9GAMM|nr:MAG: hypothetical protein BECKDK2373C_GA0170839_101931 [Candidatus Kentron sp. DK]